MICVFVNFVSANGLNFPSWKVPRLFEFHTYFLLNGGLHGIPPQFGTLIDILLPLVCWPIFLFPLRLLSDLGIRAMTQPSYTEAVLFNNRKI